MVPPTISNATLMTGAACQVALARCWLVTEPPQRSSGVLTPFGAELAGGILAARALVNGSQPTAIYLCQGAAILVPHGAVSPSL
ncbi:MAG TPA: hypothetical protein VE338_06335 [Ktedonobacterales bacterium]|nr:hypothetical protein [Ktedonobacterales bacterium]